MKIALIGRTAFLLETGNYLLKKDVDIDLVITSKSADHDKITESDFQKFAEKANAKFLKIQNINSETISSILKKSKLDLGISVNNPLLIKKEIFDQFKFGILNAHAGDLPRYRGNACPNWAIINGEKTIGLSIQLMSDEVDAGNVLLKRKFTVKKNTKIGDFYKFAEKEIPIMFFDCICNLKKYISKSKIQNKKNILRTYPRNKTDGKIEWSKNMTHIDRLIRASGTPFFGAYTYLENSKLFLIEYDMLKPSFDFNAEYGQVVGRNKDGSVSVACNDGFIIIKKIRFHNKIYSKPSQVITSIHMKLGMNVEEEIEKINIKLDEILEKIK